MSRLIYLVLLPLLVQLATVTSIEITTAMDEATIDRYILEPKLNKPGQRHFHLFANFEKTIDLNSRNKDDPIAEREITIHLLVYRYGDVMIKGIKGLDESHIFDPGYHTLRAMAGPQVTFRSVAATIGHCAQVSMWYDAEQVIAFVGPSKKVNS